MALSSIHLYFHTFIQIFIKYQCNIVLKGIDYLGSNPIFETNKLYKPGQVVRPPYASSDIFKMEIRGVPISKYLFNTFIVLMMCRSHSKLFHKYGIYSYIYNMHIIYIYINVYTYAFIYKIIG